MTKVKIKHPNPASAETKSALLRILGRHDVYVNRAIPVRDGLLAILTEARDSDNLFKQTTLADLSNEHFIPVLPPEIKASRTVLLFGVDSHILQHSPQEIKDELQRINDFTNNNIDAVIKFPNNIPMLKVTFLETPPALKCLETGLKLFNIRIPNYKIKQEEYVPIKTCMRCYAVEDHNTGECPKETEYKICSECGTVGHV